MDKQKFDTKANEILIWLDANDAGSLGPVIEATIQAGLAETDEQALDRYWNSIRSLCGNLGEKNPVRRGTPSKHSPEALANVDSVETRLMNAFASIGEADLILDIFHPRQNDNHQGHYESIDSWAQAMAASGRRYMMEALNQSRWDGSMTDNLTNMALKEPKTTKTEVSDSEWIWVIDASPVLHPFRPFRGSEGPFFSIEIWGCLQPQSEPYGCILWGKPWYTH